MTVNYVLGLAPALEISGISSVQILQKSWTRLQNEVPCVDRHTERSHTHIKQPIITLRVYVTQLDYSLSTCFSVVDQILKLCC